jgi:hypothetical protein
MWVGTPSHQSRRVVSICRLLDEMLPVHRIGRMSG